MIYVKTILGIIVLAVLLAVGPSPCFADWGIETVSKERAKELGVEIRSKAGSSSVSIELEIKSEGELKNFSREKPVHVELQMREGETCLVSATLKEDRSKPGSVVVSFAADRAHLDMITLRVWVAQVLGGDIFEFRVKDFVEPEKAMRSAGAEDPPASPGNSSEAVEVAQPPLRARLLFVKREWDANGADQIRQEVIEALQEAAATGNAPGIDESHSMNLGAFLPETGHAAAFKPQQFESLVQWLRERELLVNEMPIDLKPTRFDDRWTATINPTLHDGVSTGIVWHLGVGLVGSVDPAAVGYVNVQRTHSRRGSPSGPKLRGAAVDHRKRVSFLLPRSSVVVMSWQAHPADLERAPKVDQRSVEPILVFDEAPAAEQPAPAKAKFERPERVLELTLE